MDSSQELSKYMNKLEFIRQTAEQVIKDFDMFGLKIEFSGNAYNAYEELFNQIEPHIEKLMNGNPSKFLSILYRIDLSEEQIRKKAAENTSEPFPYVLTDLILRRELQKVVLRNHFKGQ